jgi:hypothetical protein
VTSIFITSTIQDSKKEGEDSRIVLSHSDRLDVGVKVRELRLGRGLGFG